MSSPRQHRNSRRQSLEAATSFKVSATTRKEDELFFREDLSSTLPQMLATRFAAKY
jgi:hypothetical protein